MSESYTPPKFSRKSPPLNCSDIKFRQVLHVTIIYLHEHTDGMRDREEGRREREEGRRQGEGRR
jgi:hypothetical protein